ncbi:MAG: glycosyltransferase family 39 protein [Actinomycetota bacterium]|nr:glycosyltransferase family 39 protein [Actinomycetota bacterium]
MSRRAAITSLTLLSLLFAGLGMAQAWRDAPTWDEGIYIASGVTTLTRHQIRLNLEHPPLAKVVAALPALLAHPDVPKGESWERGEQFSYTDEFVDAQVAAGKLQKVVFLARLIPLAEAVAIGALLYMLAAALFGRAAGVLAGGVWLTTPVVLGLGHLDTIDVPFTLVTLIACLALHRGLHRPSWSSVLLLGLACGLTLLVRTTGLVLTGAIVVALIAGCWGAWGWGGLLRGAAVGFVAWASVWVGVRALAPFPERVAADQQLQVQGEVLEEPPRMARVIAAAGWPPEYAAGIRYLARVSFTPAPTFLLGQSWEGARLWYWPGSMLVKLPLPVLAVLLGGLVCWKTLDPPTRRRAMFVLWVPGAALAAFTVTQPRPLGLRYLLPVIALWLAAASPLVTVARTVSGRVAFAVIAAAQVAILVSSSPHSLAWTSPPFRPGYRFATDSNLDWGQDFYRLQQWARGRAPMVAYFGGPGLSVEDIPGARPLLGADVASVEGWVAASASFLTAYQRQELAWLRKYCPVGTIAGTILVYWFERPPDSTPGPSAPAPPCRTGPSRVTSG